MPNVVDSLPNWLDPRRLAAGAGLQLVDVGNGRVEIQLAGATQTVFGAMRTADLTRNGGAVGVVDPQLTIANIPAGSYSFDAYLRVDNSGAGGFGVNHNFDVAPSSPNAGLAYFLSLSPNPSSQMQAGWQAYTTSSAWQSGLTRAFASGGVQFSQTTTFTFEWGQAAAVGNTTLVAGSWVRFTRLA